MNPERSQLVEAHVEITTRYARKHCWRGEDPNDVISDALYGLTLAARRFDPSRGTFAATAVRSIKAQISRGRQTRSGMSRTAWETRQPRHLSLSVPISDDTALGDLLEHPDRDIDTATDRLGISQAFGVLPRHERIVVDLRYRGELSQSKVADRLGCSQMQVCRLERRALGRMRAALEREAA